MKRECEDATDGRRSCSNAYAGIQRGAAVARSRHSGDVVRRRLHARASRRFRVVQGRSALRSSRGRINVQVHGTAALLTAESWTATSTLGQEAHAHIRLLAVYVADSNGLRLAHFQSVLLHA